MKVEENMKYLILGVNGMAGHMIAQYLKENGQTVTGFAKNQSAICQTIKGNAFDVKDIGKVLASDDYDYVVNCIGVLNQFVDANPAEGIFLNSVLPHLLAEKLVDKKTKLIHISTDCVFEGTKGQYHENDIPDATSYYGRSKMLGEVVDDKNLTIRTSIVGPELKKEGIGLFHWFMSQTDYVYGYEKVLWTGITTLQLAKFIEMDRENPHTGLYHLVNNKIISKHDLLELFNRYCRKHPIQIRSDKKIVSDKSLVNTRKDKAAIPDYQTMVIELENWITEHSAIYEQYKGV